MKDHEQHIGLKTPSSINPSILTNHCQSATGRRNTNVPLICLVEGNAEAVRKGVRTIPRQTPRQDLRSPTSALIGGFLF